MILLNISNSVLWIYIILWILVHYDTMSELIVLIRAREIVGFAGSGPIFEIENRFISRQEAKKSVHKTLYF